MLKTSYTVDRPSFGGAVLHDGSAIREAGLPQPRGYGVHSKWKSIELWIFSTPQFASSIFYKGLFPVTHRVSTTL